MNPQKYTGKVVIAERANPTEKHSGYNDGQYLIYAETESQLFGLRLDGTHGGFTPYGFGGYNSSGLPLAGEAAYRIAAADDVEPWMLDSLDRLDDTVQAVRSGEQKATWVMGVYESAANRSRMIRKVIEDALIRGESATGVGDAAGLDAACCETAAPPIVQITVPFGVHVQVSHA